MGFSQTRPRFFLVHVHGVLISVSKIIPFQFEGLGSLLFNDVV